MKSKIKIKKFVDKIRAKKWYIYTTDFLSIAIGTFLMGIAYSVFFVPNNISPSGFSGLSNMISYFIKEETGFLLPASILYLVINFVLFLFAFRNMGLKFCLYAGVGIGLYSLFMQLCNFAVFIPSDNSKLLVAVFGGVISGVGLGLVIRVGSSTGGTDMLSIMVNRYFPSIPTGSLLLIVNSAVICISILAFGFTNALYAIIAVYISTRATDAMIDGVSAVRAYYIVSDKSTQIKMAIQQELKRGVTQLRSKDKNNDDRIILICLVKTSQVVKLKEIIKDIDSDSFVFSTKVKEAIGSGFFTKPEKTTLTKLKNMLRSSSLFAKHKRNRENRQSDVMNDLKGDVAVDNGQTLVEKTIDNVEGEQNETNSLEISEQE